MKSRYEDAYGRSQPEYLCTRDGFSLLVMGFTEEEVLKWKLKYIDAFNQMEAFIQERRSSEWLVTRKQGKLIRLDGNRHPGKSGGLRRGPGKPEHAEEGIHPLFAARQQPCRHPERRARNRAVQNALRCWPKDKWVAVLLCFFFGVVGAHKFYEGKVGMGLVYICTGGLCGIGALFDLIVLLGRTATHLSFGCP